MFQHSKVSLSILLNLYVDTRVWSSYVPKSKKTNYPWLSHLCVFFLLSLEYSWAVKFWTAEVLFPAFWGELLGLRPLFPLLNQLEKNQRKEKNFVKANFSRFGTSEDWKVILKTNKN